MTRFSSASDMDTSDFVGDACALAAAATGESATSDSDDVPGLSFVFFEGEGLSTGPGVARPVFVFDGSSGWFWSVNAG